jgi:ATP phosphoribosyltransferase regulatory subunit
VTEAEAHQALIALFAREGYRRVEPPVLQPADVFIDLSGEDIRRRMFVTQDAAGEELCLRPEYTIPVCRAHLAGAAGGPGSYGYLGPVFRLRTGETGEFLQAGIESIGRADIAAADAEILALALEGLDVLGLASAGCNWAIWASSTRWWMRCGSRPLPKRRVMRAIVSGAGLGSLAEPEGAAPEHAGLLAAIEGQAPQAAKAFVEDILSIAGIARVGGRSAGEIAERFLARAANRSGFGDEARSVLERYLAITGDPDQAAAAIRALAGDAGLDIGAALDAFEQRTGFMAVRGLDVGSFAFTAAFARNLDYYTGFIFEVQDPRPPGRQARGRRRPLRPAVAASRRAGADPRRRLSYWLDRIGGSAR